MNFVIVSAARANAHGSNHLYGRAISSLVWLGKIRLHHKDNCFREHWVYLAMCLVVCSVLSCSVLSCRVFSLPCLALFCYMFFFLLSKLSCFLSCLGFLLSCLVVAGCALLCVFLYVLSCLVLSSLVLSFLFFAMSCLVLSCVLSCLPPSCLILPCRVCSCVLCCVNV